MDIGLKMVKTRTHSWNDPQGQLKKYSQAKPCLKETVNIWIGKVQKKIVTGRRSISTLAFPVLWLNISAGSSHQGHGQCLPQTARTRNTYNTLQHHNTEDLHHLQPWKNQKSNGQMIGIEELWCLCFKSSPSEENAVLSPSKYTPRPSNKHWSGVSKPSACSAPSLLRPIWLPPYPAKMSWKNLTLPNVLGRLSAGWCWMMLRWFSCGDCCSFPSFLFPNWDHRMILHLKADILLLVSANIRFIIQKRHIMQWISMLWMNNRKTWRSLNVLMPGIY